jgi:hypothetical protein
VKSPGRKRSAVSSGKCDDPAKFDVSREPPFEPKYPYWKFGSFISTFELEVFQFRTWRIFREHTSHWPVLSISFHCLSYAAMVAGILTFFPFTERHGWSEWKSLVCFGIGLILWVAIHQVGSITARKADGMLFGRD